MKADGRAGGQHIYHWLVKLFTKVLIAFLFLYFFFIKEQESLGLCEEVSLTSLKIPTVSVSYIESMQP